MEGKKRAILDLKRLSEAITEFLQRQNRPLCAGCLTESLAAEHGAENVDVRVAMVHLALGQGLIESETCGRCSAPDGRRNPVMRFASQAGPRSSAA